MTMVPVKSGYVDVHSANLYYERYGAGDPVILLHGGLGSIEIFAPILPLLSQSRRVIAFDLHGHGRSADVDRPFQYEEMADDIAAAVRKLGYERADFVGYSHGAFTSLQTAIRHPDLVANLVVVSAPCRKSGWLPEINAAMKMMSAETAEMMKPSPLYQHYAAVAPDPKNWTNLVLKMHDIVTQEFDWSADVARIAARTMLVYGDADSIPTSHVAEFYGLLGGGSQDGNWDGSGMSRARLAIVPGATHYDILSSPLIAPIIESFLNGSMPGPRQ